MKPFKAFPGDYDYSNDDFRGVIKPTEASDDKISQFMKRVLCRLPRGKSSFTKDEIEAAMAKTFAVGDSARGNNKKKVSSSSIMKVTKVAKVIDDNNDDDGDDDR